MGEGGASRSEATGEGFAPQAPHHRPTAKRIRSFAKKMRREATDAEAAMWRLLRDRRFARFKFRRQVPFQSFILDFVCFDSASSSKSMVVSTHCRSVMQRETPS